MRSKRRSPSWTRDSSSGLGSSDLHVSSWSVASGEWRALGRNSAGCSLAFASSQLGVATGAEKWIARSASSSSLGADPRRRSCWRCAGGCRRDQRQQQQQRQQSTQSAECASQQRRQPPPPAPHSKRWRRGDDQITSSNRINNRANNNCGQSASLSSLANNEDSDDDGDGATSGTSVASEPSSAARNRNRNRNHDDGAEAADDGDSRRRDSNYDTRAPATVGGAPGVASTASTSTNTITQNQHDHHARLKPTSGEKSENCEQGIRLANNRCAQPVDPTGRLRRGSSSSSNSSNNNNSSSTDTQSIEILGENEPSDATLACQELEDRQEADFNVRLELETSERPTGGYDAIVCEQHEQRRPQLESWAPPNEPQAEGFGPTDLGDAMQDGGHLKPLAAPKCLPNNTVVADLSRCHRELAGPLCSRPAASGRLLARLAAGQRRASSSGGRPPRFTMPEQIARLHVNLKPVDYDSALSALTSDVRYQLHLLLYGRVQVAWALLTTAICISVPIAFTHLAPPVLAGACSLWLALQLAGTLLATRLRRKLDQMLESSVAQANGFFMDHNLMLGVLNTPSFWSGSNLMVPLLYFDTSTCREHIESLIRADCLVQDADDNNQKANWRRLDYSKLGLPLAKSNVIAFAQSQLAKKIVLRYSQRWISYFDKRKLMFTDDHTEPRHLSTGKCLCQFIEEHFKNQSEVQCTSNSSKKPTIGNKKNSYANIKATKLAINGGTKQQRQQQQNGSITKPSIQVPSLSKLVSERQDSYKIDMTESETEHKRRPRVASLREQVVPLTADQGDGSAPSDLSDMQQQQRRLSMDAAYSSLEIDGDTIGRSDDLVRKLRLLLELRGDELQGLDKSLFSGLQYEAPHGYSPYLSDHSQQGGFNGTPTQGSDFATRHDARQPAGNGKRFFSQTEGFFFLSGSNKKNHRQQDIKPASHILEIC